MFVVLSDALPRNWLLFEASGTGSTSRTSPTGMDARIAVGNEIISLSQLKQTARFQKRGAAGCCRSTSGRAERSRSPT
jgi:hypothetical protein